MDRFVAQSFAQWIKSDGDGILYEAQFLALGGEDFVDIANLRFRSARIRNFAVNVEKLASQFEAAMGQEITNAS